MKKIIILIIFLFTSASIFSQSINIFDIDTSAFPIMKAKIYAFDKDGNLQRPNSSELKISENGINRTITNVTCPTPKPLQKVSLAMSIDISGSMAQSDFGEVPVELGKLTATELCKLIAMPPSEFALQTCHSSSTIIQDFTTSRSKILKAIPPIKAGGDNDFVEHLLNKLTGLLNIAKKGKEKRVAVLYTDAWWYALAPNELQACLDTCKKYKIEFYTVIYSRKEAQPNGIKASLRELCTKSGGYFYDGVTSTEAAKNIANNIQKVVQGAEPCEISWDSDLPCISSNIKVELYWQDQKSISTYNHSSISIAELKVSPNSLAFGKRLPSTQNDTTITLTAKNSDFNIKGISIKFGSADFAVVNTTFPISIPKNTSANITFKFAPSDSNRKYASFEIETDKCPAYFSANGGFPDQKLPVSTLKLTHPNGGETFVVGSDTLITWNGVSPSDTVSLEYSIDKGKSWKSISKQATGLKYNWKKVPIPSSIQCLVRIKLGRSYSDTNSVLTISGHSNVVNGIAYSPDASKVVTAGWDKTAKIWDANSGALIRTLSGHSDHVYGIAFSPSANKVATSSSDHTAKIWDASTGALIRTLSGHSNKVYSIAFSPDASKVATASEDNTAKIWDASTGALIRTLSGHTNKVYSIAFSPDASKVATASEDNTAKIWDASTGDLIRTLSGHSFWVNGIAFSPDASKVATASSDFTAKIWDANTGALIRTLSGHKNYVIGIAFSPDASKIATASEDNTAKIWDANSGALIRTLLGHTNIINGIAFSPDASKIATASSDNTAKIWDINETTIQEDQSDAVFSIVAPSPSSIDIDMKQCLVGRSRDSLISTFVQNKGTYPFRVDSISIKGKNANQFMIVSGIPPFAVPASNSRAVEFRFKPNSVGIKTAQVLIYTQADTLIQNIQGEGVSPSLSIINNLIDFGNIKINSKKDSLNVFTIKNIGSSPLKIDSITQGGPNFEYFSTLSASGTFTLAVNDSAKLDLRFSPLEKGRTSGSVLFHYNGVGSPAQVQLFGQGNSGSASATIICDNIQAYPGDIIEIPIMIKDTNDLYKSTSKNLKVDLKFNATLLEPIGETPNGTWDNNNNTRTIQLDLPTKADTNGVLGTFKFKVGLGNDSTTFLNLTDPSSDSNDVDLQVASGEFHLLGICRAAGPRLINPNGEVKLSLIRPNPVGDNGELDIETIENGQTELYIVNLKGEKVATLYQGELAAGKQTLIISTKDLSNGTYFVILQTPTVTQKVKMEVVK